MKYLYLIAVFNAFLFIVLLFQKKNRAVHDNILMVWLAYFGAFIGVYAFYSHDLFTHFKLLSASLLALFMLQGPLLYTYIQTLCAPIINSIHVQLKPLMVIPATIPGSSDRFYLIGAVCNPSLSPLHPI